MMLLHLGKPRTIVDLRVMEIARTASRRHSDTATRAHKATRFSKWYVAAGAAWIALYFLSNNPIAQQVMFPVTGVVAFGAILLGVRRNRPGARRPWILLAFGILLWGLGDIIWSSYDLILHRVAPWPSAADYIYLAGPVFMALGLIGILRHRHTGRDVDGLIDTLIVAAGVGTLSWAFFMSPYAHDASLTTVAKLVAIAYPLVDILLLGVVVRLLLAPGKHVVSHRLLATSLLFTLVGDVVYSVQGLTGSYYTGHIVDATWLGFYVLIGAAALHPSMASTTQMPSIRARKPNGRLGLLAGAASLAPLSLFIQSQRGAIVDVPVIAGASILLFSLVVFRMERLVREVNSKVRQLQSQGDELRRSLTNRKELEGQLRHQAVHDPLTGLANSVLFKDRLDHALRHVARAAEAVGMLYLDVDNFKLINDTMGHEAGDRVLREVAVRLTDSIRATDTAARLGGDEFAILLERMVDPADAVVVADRIRTAMSPPFVFGDNAATVRVSIGISSTRDKAVTPRELQSQADVAMYAAKRRGKNNYVVYEPELQKEILDPKGLREDLGKALERGEMRAVYQPIVNLESGRPIGAEALIRWDHPVQGVIPPLAFLPLAERVGIILDLDMWMLKQACKEGIKWRRAGILGPLKINVNLSGASLQHPDLVATVCEILRSTGANPRSIGLELTESVLISDVDVTARRLADLKKLGLSIAIDDFGTGYSSLSHLKRFPIDVIKIDKSFVDEVAAGPEEGSFAETIAALARQLHLSTVAEGVERPEQVDALIALGADSAQGYYFSRPLSAEDIRAWLAEADFLVSAPTS
jgi:diguanylate cyclase (GGDEF)-like protein